MAGHQAVAYEDALSYEFGARGVEFERQVALPVQYKGHLLAPVFRADYICFGRVIVELKASSSLGPADDAQVLNYLKATTAARGLLVNFGEPRLRYRRFVNGWIPDHSQAEDGETGHLRASATSAVA